MAYIKGQAFIAQYVDDNGDNAENQTFEFYLSGTSTPTNVFKDSSGTVLGTSFTLNASGKPEDSGGTEVDVFFDDSIDYKIIHKDSAGTQIDPVIDPFRAVSGAISTATIQNSTSVYGVNNGSTTNAHAIDLTPTLTALAAGQKFHYIAPFANTGAVTLDIDGIGPAAVVWPDDTALVTGDIPLSAMIEVVYNGSKFHLISVTGRASTTQAGPIEIATDAEADTGTDTARAITPANLAYILDGTGGTNQVETAAIADSAITTAKINDGDVTLAKFASNLRMWTLIEEQTASGSPTSIDFTTGISGYDEYMLTFDNYSASGSGPHDILWRTGNGGSFDATGYSERVDDNGTQAANTSATSVKIGESDSGDYGAGVIHIFGAESATYTGIIAHSFHNEAAAFSMYESVGTREESLAHDRFQILVGSGTIASGEFRLYGRRT